MRYLGTAILIFSLTFGGVRQDTCQSGRSPGSSLNSPAVRITACTENPGQATDPCCQKKRSQDAESPSRPNPSEQHSNTCPCTGASICSCVNPVDLQIPVFTEWRMTMNPLQTIRTSSRLMETMNIQPTSPPPKFA